MPFTPLPKALLKASINYRGQRRALLREQFFRVAGRFTPLLVAEQDGLRFFVRTDDHGVGRLTFADMSFERGTLDKAFVCLEALGAERDQIRSGWFLDIGANTGTTSITAVAAYGMAGAICFEPVPSNYQLLESNAAANGVSDQVRCVHLALSDRDATLDFERPTGNWGDGRIRVKTPDSHATHAYGEADRDLIEVEAVRLDTLVDRGDVDLGQVSLAWIDAQGHEGNILAGAASLVASKIPIVTEFWPYGLKRADGLEQFCALVSEGFHSFVDLGTLEDPALPSVRPASDVRGLASDYGGVAFTDLLLLS